MGKTVMDQIKHGVESLAPGSSLPPPGVIKVMGYVELAVSIAVIAGLHKHARKLACVQYCTPLILGVFALRP